MSQSNQDPRLRFYFRSMDHYIELPLEDSPNIFAANWYDPSQKTVFFTHGFTGGPNGPAVKEVISAYLEKGNYNVVLLNWEYLASPITQNFAGSYLNWAVPNAKGLGQKFADVLENLFKAGLNIDKTHYIGHSLGAHILGIAGNTLSRRGISLPWITGLDPANLGFEGRPLPTRIHAGSATFVDIIHSDPGKYGYKRSHGTVDFWPNYNMRGPLRQPGCGSRNQLMFSSEDLCNHNRSWQLWVDMLRHPGTIIGSYAKNYRAWKNYSPAERNFTTLELGTNDPKIKAGDYFFVTSHASPYGLGGNGFYDNRS